MTHTPLTTNTFDAWSDLIGLTEAIAKAGDLPDDAFNELSDQRLDAQDAVMALHSPESEVLRRLVSAGIDRDVELIKAVAGL